MVTVTGLEKTYSTARGSLTLFKDLSFQVVPGELVAITGQSGSGKSTLLHILGALDRPSAGTVYCASTNVASLNSRQAAAFRNREIGYVWQFHYLLPEFTAQENVAMPLLARGMAETGSYPNWRPTGFAKWAWKTAAIIAPVSSPEENSSASPWPALLSITLGCSLPTNPPATWTSPPRARSLI